MRSEQKSVVAVCACSAVSEVHLLRPAICLFAGGCICRGAVDASPVCPWERFTSFGASECSDLICPARFTRRTHVVSSFCRRTRCKQLLYAICVPKHRPAI